MTALLILLFGLTICFIFGLITLAIFPTSLGFILGFVIGIFLMIWLLIQYLEEISDKASMEHYNQIEIDNIRNELNALIKSENKKIQYKYDNKPYIKDLSETEKNINQMERSLKILKGEED